MLATDERAIAANGSYVVVPSSLGCDKAFAIDGAQWCWGEGQIHHREETGWVATLPDPFATTGGADYWDALPTNLWVGGQMRAAWSSRPDLAFRQPVDGELERYDGSSWRSAGLEGVVDIDGRDGQVWFAVRDRGLYGWARSVSPVLLPAIETGQPVTHVHALSGGVLVVVDEKRLWRYDGDWSRLLDAGTRYIGDVAGTGPDDIWVTLPRISRTPDFEVHHYDGADWQLVALHDGVSSRGSLVTRNGETWMAHHGATVLDLPTLTRVDADANAITTPWLPYNATLWPTPDALWITSHNQAYRLGR
jgi:hypothetical protein